jgi:hypothetical protein
MLKAESLTRPIGKRTTINTDANATVLFDQNRIQDATTFEQKAEPIGMRWDDTMSPPRGE